MNGLKPSDDQNDQSDASTASGQQHINGGFDPSDENLHNHYGLDSRWILPPANEGWTGSHQLAEHFGHSAGPELTDQLMAYHLQELSNPNHQAHFTNHDLGSAPELPQQTSFPRISGYDCQPQSRAARGLDVDPAFSRIPGQEAESLDSLWTDHPAQGTVAPFQLDTKAPAVEGPAASVKTRKRQTRQIDYRYASEGELDQALAGSGDEDTAEVQGPSNKKAKTKASGRKVKGQVSVMQPAEVMLEGQAGMMVTVSPEESINPLDEENPSVLDVRLSDDENRRMSMLRKLHTALSRPDSILYIHWDDTGSVVVVPDSGNFNQHLGGHFKRNGTFNSFAKALIQYGFGKKQEKSAERDTWFFKHERFLKGREDLVGAVTATKIHGNTQIPMIRADPDSGNRRRTIVTKAPRQVKDELVAQRIILQQENDHFIRENHELRSQLESYRLALHQEKGRNERLRHLLASDYNITTVDEHHPPASSYVPIYQSHEQAQQPLHRYTQLYGQR